MSCFGFYQVKHDNTKERYKDEENEVGVTQGFCNCKIVGNEVVEKKGDKTENKKIHPLVPSPAGRNELILRSLQAGTPV